MPGYDRDYDREYEGDYDTEEHGERLRSARAADRAFSASMPSAVQVQNSISMGDVSGRKSDASYLGVLMGAWEQNRRRVIAVSSVAAILAIVAIALSLTIDSTPAPAQAAVDPRSNSQPNAINTKDPFEGKECVGNKLHYDKQLLHNQYICSARNKYVFGLNIQGELLWGNDDSNFNHKIYTTNSENNTAHKFLLGQHGRFEILDESNETIWNKKSIYGNEITPMDNNPINNLTVPYLSMHNDGVVVLVYYNRTAGELQEHNIQKIYPISN